MTFRKYQSIYDLQSAAANLLGHFERDLTSFENYVRDRLAKSRSERLPHWKLDIAEASWASLAEQACSPEDSREAFLFATCVLLLDRFENSHRGGDLQWEWDAFAGEYRSAPDAIRAALMNGFEEARNHSLISSEIRPTNSDLVTNAEDDVLEKLKDLARSLTLEEQSEIATADYGTEVERQLEALQLLLKTNDCRFPDTWFPAEVVELVSHVPSASGFAGCTALVLINAIYDGDHVNNASFRWRANKLSYLDLPFDARSSVMAAFRHLYETVPIWNPFEDEFAPERLPNHAFVPWFPEW